MLASSVSLRSECYELDAVAYEQNGNIISMTRQLQPESYIDIAMS